MRSQSLKLVLLLLGLGGIAVSSGCGGEVHFVTDNAPLPPPSPPVDQSIHEKFTYGQPSGSQVVVFLFGPRKYMRRTSTGLFDTIDHFSKIIWGRTDSLTRLEYRIVRDVEPFQISEFNIENPNAKDTKSTLEGNSLQFLKTSFSNLPPQLEEAETINAHPFYTLKEISENIILNDPNKPQPTWLHLIYFRDNDIIYNSDLERDIKASMLDFKKGLSQKPLSANRTKVYFVSHMTPGNSGEVSAHLQGLFKSFNSSFKEIKNISESDQSKQIAFMEELAGEINSFSQRIILGTKPNLTTLEVKIGETSIPREQISFDEGSNEISFRTSAVPQPQIGDVIEVRYEEKKG